MTQVLAIGFLNGLAYAAVGLAFGLVYSSTRVLHIAMGGIFVISPYITYGLLQQGAPWVVAVFAAITGTEPTHKVRLGPAFAIWH